MRRIVVAHNVDHLGVGWPIWSVNSSSTRRRMIPRWCTSRKLYLAQKVESRTIYGWISYERLTVFLVCQMESRSWRWSWAGQKEGRSWMALTLPWRSFSTHMQVLLVVVYSDHLVHVCHPVTDTRLLPQGRHTRLGWSCLRTQASASGVVQSLSAQGSRPCGQQGRTGCSGRQGDCGRRRF